MGVSSSNTSGRSVLISEKKSSDSESNFNLLVDSQNLSSSKDYRLKITKPSVFSYIVYSKSDKKNLDNLYQEIDSLKNEISRLLKITKEKDKEISDSKRDIENYRKDNLKLSSTIKEKDEKIAELIKKGEKKNDYHYSPPKARYSPPRHYSPPRYYSPPRDSNSSVYGGYSPPSPCFNGDAIVLLENNMKKMVKNLKRGDKINNGAVVECLVETKITSSKLYMCNINGVFFTRRHPVLYKGTWSYPIDIKLPEAVPFDSYYSIILKDDVNKKYEVEFENKIKAITLAHNRTDYKILEHPFFGTNAILESLKKRDPLGYKNGYILLHAWTQKEIKKNVKDEMKRTEVLMKVKGYENLS